MSTDGMSSIDVLTKVLSVSLSSTYTAIMTCPYMGQLHIVHFNMPADK
jgi:hypothetical protein